MELDAYLRQPGLRRALDGARAQVERLDRVGGTVVLDELGDDEAIALSGLLGGLRRRAKPRAGQRFRLAVCDLETALLASRFEISLGEALERNGAPLDPRPRRLERQRAATAEIWERAARHPLCVDEPRVSEWIVGLRERGALPRVDGLLTRALDVGARLPCDPPVERTRLAAELTGDPHALDDDRPLSRLLTGQLAFRCGEPRPSTARGRRALWRMFGVLGDAASADVLTLGLRPLEGGPLASALTALHGWHVRLTVGQLARERLRFPPGLDVSLCENVTVLTAAEARYGSACPPLLCLEGWPSSAGWALLDALVRDSATFRYYGDFDWDGLRIASLVYEQISARPWRFSAADYLVGVSSHADRTRPLDGRVAAEGHQRELVAAMLDSGRELHEEAVLEDLLTDLALCEDPRPGTESVAPDVSAQRWSP
jgi:uncharacterized protein (TIGR02679 family)